MIIVVLVTLNNVKIAFKTILKKMKQKIANNVTFSKIFVQNV